MKFINELEIDVGRCLHAIGKKKKFVCLVAILCFIIGVGYTLDEGVDLYSATATAYAADNGSYAGSSNAVTAMNAYLDVAESYKVCQRAALIMGRTDIDVTDIMDSVYAYSSLDGAKSSSINAYLASTATTIYFVAQSEDPSVAMEMADAMAQAYVIEMENILGTDSVKLLDEAYTYGKSYDATRDAWKTRILALIAGLILGMLIVVFYEIFDKKVRTIREASVRGELPIIGVIPDYKE